MNTIKRRALVLTDEAAGHPFRRTLPAHVRSLAFPVDESADKPRRWRLTMGDWRGFFSAYCLAFVAVSLFIA